MPSGRILAAASVGLLALGVVAGCGGNDQVLVLVASSAQDAVREVAATSPAPAAVVSGGSSSLVRQLSGGAQADVLITADEATMARARAEGLIEGEPVTVASSELVLAVPAAATGSSDAGDAATADAGDPATADAGQPVQVAGLSDLADPDVDVVLCSPPVPCGAAAAAALTEADVEPNVRSYEPNSRQALAKVALGVADATLVWEVDLLSDDRVEQVPVSEELPSTRYRAAVVADAEHPEEARRFIARLLSPAGQEILSEHGFQPAPVPEQVGPASSDGAR